MRGKKRQIIGPIPWVLLLLAAPAPEVRAQPSGGFLSRFGGEDPWILLKQGGNTAAQVKAVRDIVASRPAGAGKRLLDVFAGSTLSSNRVRIAVALAMGRLGYRPAVPYLWRMFREESRAARGAALEGLGMLLGRRMVPLLARAIRRPDLAKASQRALIRIGKPSCREMERLLSEPGVTARRAAAVLAAVGDPRSVGLLVRAMKDGVIPAVEVLPILGRYRHRLAHKVLLSALVSPGAGLSGTALRALKHPLPRGVAGALMVALSRGGIDRQKGLELLGRTGEASALTVLLSFVNDADMQLREAALTGLGELHTKAAVRALAGFLKPRFRRVYYAALRGLGNSRRPEAAAPILGHTKWSGRVGASAIQALGTLLRRRARTVGGSRGARADGLHRGVRLLRQMAAGKDDRSLAAVTALGRVGGAGALEELLGIFKKRNRSYKRLACRGLALLPGREIVVEAMEGALRGERDKHIASCAAWVLGSIKATRSVGVLVSALRDARPQVACNASAALVRLGGGQAVKALKSVLQSPDLCLRANAVLGMGQWKVRSALPRVRKALVSDASHFVRANAARALVRLLGKGARAELADRQTEENHPRVRDVIRDLVIELGEGTGTRTGKGSRKAKGRRKARGRRKGTRRPAGHPGSAFRDYLAFWVVLGGKKKTASWRFYRIVLPSGLIRKGFTDALGFAAEDRLEPGTVDLELE